MSDVKIHPILGDVKKYPAPCGCAGPKHISMCAKHQQDDIARERRLLGIDAGVNAKRYEWLRERVVAFKNRPQDTGMMTATGTGLDDAIDEELRAESALLPNPALQESVPLVPGAVSDLD